MSKFRYIDMTHAPRSEHTFGEKGSVLVMTRQNEMWFLASDVCRILGIKKDDEPQKLEQLESGERATTKLETNGGMQEVSIVSESGFYTLVMRSRKPVALPFQRWVTKEVLPSIRRTGSYTMSGRPDKGSRSEDKADEKKIVLPIPDDPVRYVVMVMPGQPPHVRETPIETILEELSSFDCEALCYSIKLISVALQRLQELFSVEKPVSHGFVMRDLERSVNRATELADRYLRLAKEMADENNRSFTGHHNS
jgi:prophage antirepressor-like protein